MKRAASPVLGVEGDMVVEEVVLPDEKRLKTEAEEVCVEG